MKPYANSAVGVLCLEGTSPRSSVAVSASGSQSGKPSTHVGDAANQSHINGTSIVLRTADSGPSMKTRCGNWYAAIAEQSSRDTNAMFIESISVVVRVMECGNLLIGQGRQSLTLMERNILDGFLSAAPLFASVAMGKKGHGLSLPIIATLSVLKKLCRIRVLVFQTTILFTTRMKIPSMTGLKI